MPIHVSPVSRRSFLATTSAAASLAVMPNLWASEAVDGSVFALLSDTHIPDQPDFVAREVNMTANLRRVVGQVCASEHKPAGVIINGDCAYLKGLPSDYKNFAACVHAVTDAGLPLHLTMGNHDDRGPFYDALAAQRPETPPVEAKHVSIVKTPHANLFLLDSLSEVNVVTGDLGQAQRTWLASALDAHADKPAIIVAHHNLQFEAPAEGTAWGGLKDTAELFKLLSARKHVKAYIYGHTHNWSLDQREGIHLVNLPPVAYVFGAGKPNGWVRATLREGGMALELIALDTSHSQHGQRVELAWR